MSEKLRPCPNPWCKTSRPQRIRTEETIACVVRSRVECVCGVKGPRCDTEDEAAAAWNRRPVEDALRDKFDSMVRVNDANLACYNNCAKENAMLKAQVKRLEDSRFALAVAHTEDVLTIERLKAPVSDKEMDRFSIHYINVINPFRSLPVLTITQATALIAARAAAPTTGAGGRQRCG